MLLTYSTFHTQYACHNSAYFIVSVSSIYFTQYLIVSVFKYSDKSKQVIFTEKYVQRTPLEKALSQELITQIKCFHFNVAEFPVVSFGFDICVCALFFALFKLLFSNIEERKIFFYVFFQYFKSIFTYFWTVQKLYYIWSCILGFFFSHFGNQLL